MYTADWMNLENEIIACRRCPRLVEWRERVARDRRRAYRDCEYWGKPVPGFGDRAARVLAVGLAPGAHGSNRTGRMFTGDASGDFLYPALCRAGFTNQPFAHNRDDGLRLKDLFITAVCRCAPPDNKPMNEEIVNCAPFLMREMDLLKDLKIYIALGAVAFKWLKNVLLEPKAKASIKFSHNVKVDLPGNQKYLIGSYHPSRQNTQTGRLTEDMFDRIWLKARSLLLELKEVDR